MDSASASSEDKEPLPWLRMLLDVALTIGALLLINGSFELSGVYLRGFFCDDETIMYPEKTETINVTALLCYGLIPQFVVIVLIEAYRLWKFPEEFLGRVENGRGRIMRLVSRILKFYGYALLCLALCSFLTAVTKNTVGRLRPNFLDVCKPSFDYRHNCTTHEYITDYICTAKRSDHALKDARQSFFSGHSSIAMTTGMFIVVYLQSRAAGDVYLNTLVPILQGVAFCFSVWIGLTRIFDHKHHWSDVLVGLTVGAWVYCAGYDLSPKKQRSRKDFPSSSSRGDIELRAAYKNNGFTAENSI